MSQRIDVTDVFAQSIRILLHLMSALVETLGAEDYRERVKRRQATLAGLDRRAEARDLRRDGNDDPIGVMGAEPPMAEEIVDDQTRGRGQIRWQAQLYRVLSDDLLLRLFERLLPRKDPARDAETLNWYCGS